MMRLFSKAAVAAVGVAAAATVVVGCTPDNSYYGYITQVENRGGGFAKVVICPSPNGGLACQVRFASATTPVGFPGQPSVPFGRLNMIGRYVSVEAHGTYVTSVYVGA